MSRLGVKAIDWYSWYFSYEIFSSTELSSPIIYECLVRLG